MQLGRMLKIPAAALHSVHSLQPMFPTDVSSAAFAASIVVVDVAFPAAWLASANLGDWQHPVWPAPGSSQQLPR